MKILVVDDHPVLREGLSALLRQTVPETTVLQAGGISEALHILSEHDDLDIVMLDLVMPGGGGMSAISDFGRMRADLPVIMLTSSEDPGHVRQALALGALGYVPKSSSPQTLLAAIRFVMDGNVYVPPLMLGVPVSSNVAPTPGPCGAGVALTDRQVQVLQRLGEGHPNKIIAAQLDLAEKTVKAHVTAIFRVLNVVNRSQAILAGRKAGLI